MDPVTLLFFQCPKSAYRPKIVSDNEIFCSPDEVDRVVGGQVMTLNCPEGQFDIKPILDKLPPEQKPELIVAKVDGGLRNMPTGLSAIDCPKLMIIGSPQMFEWPVTSLLKYQEREKYDFIVSDHDRHQLHFFQRAGNAPTYWLPAMNYCLRERRVAEPEVNRAVFVGSTGKFHPFRNRILESLIDSKLPITVQTAPPVETPNLYSRYTISLNCSLNSGMNLRVFEVMGCGGFLLTDRLAYNSGLEMLFEDGKDLVLYDGIDDLKEKISHYLAHPEETIPIRQSGQKKILEQHLPEQRSQQLLDIVFKGETAPYLDLRDDRFNILSSLPKEDLYSDVARFEFIQDMHKSSERVVIYCSDPSCPPLQYAEGLARLEFRGMDKSSEAYPESTSLGLPEERYLYIDASIEGESEALIGAFLGRFAILAPELEANAGIIECLAGSGFQAEPDRPGLFVLKNEIIGIAKAAEKGKVSDAIRLLEAANPEVMEGEESIQCAQLANNLGRPEIVSKYIKDCLFRDRTSIDLYTALAQAESDLGNLDQAYIALHEAIRIGGDTGELSEALEAFEAGGALNLPAVREYLELVGKGERRTILRPGCRVLVCTNLFPPQELGGYGRKMWEFSVELQKRGHELLVVSGDATYLYKEPSEDEAVLEDRVHRDLTLYGEWKDGSANWNVPDEQVPIIMHENRKKLAEHVERFSPDFCLMGNLDMIGYLVIEELTSRNIPVVHCLGNFIPGFPQELIPSLELYRAGPASNWLHSRLKEEGFRLFEPEVIYPGARTDQFYRHILPFNVLPRIVFAGLMMPYKGPQTLLEALLILKSNGIAFEAIFAGDSTDSAFVDGMKKVVTDEGLEDCVSFPGFCNREELVRVFDRSNILVFPSVCEETFGISHVEAMASGLAVISTGRGGAKEIINDGVDGMLFEGENAAELAQKIALLLANPIIWKEMQEAGRKRAFDFSIPASVDIIEGLFKKLQPAPAI